MIPPDHSRISTDLTPTELETVISAIEKQEVKWSDSSGFAEVTVGFFEYLGQKFRLYEYCELVTGIFKETEA